MAEDFDDEGVPADEDRLPWLEAVEEEEAGPSVVKLIAAVLIGLIAIGAVVSGLFWLGNRDGGGNGEVIASQGDYKMRPSDPGGQQFDNQSSTQVAASDGAAPNASLNGSGRSEAPVTGNGAAARPQAPAPAPAAPAPPAAQRPGQPAPAQPQGGAQAQSRLTGPTIQLGAFPSEGAANAEWTRLSGRHAFLGSLRHEVTVFQRGNATFYRLRAAGAQANEACRRLQAANQPCIAVPN